MPAVQSARFIDFRIFLSVSGDVTGVTSGIYETDSVYADTWNGSFWPPVSLTSKP
jgi:hypothetical protein